MESASLERLVPKEISAQDKFSHASYNLHLERYRFAVQHALPGRLLDCACGVGYGAFEMVQAREDLSCTAVDIAEDAIRYAKQNYAHPRIRFLKDDAFAYFESEKFSTIVSLETIEHVAHSRALIEHFVSLLNPGGRLIVSAPITPSMDFNPHHLHDFSEASFRRLFAGLGLKEVAVLAQTQTYSPLVLQKKQGRLRGIRLHLFGYYLKHPELLWRRLSSLLKDGLHNKYLTLVWEKRPE